MKAYTHLDSGERIAIESLHFERHESVWRLVRDLHRSPLTVIRELKYGLWFASEENESYGLYRRKRLKTSAWTVGPFCSALTATQGQQKEP